MKREYSFEIHAHAPEINKAFINGVAVPDYLVKAGTHEEMVRDLRSWFRRRKKGFSVVVESTGAASSLPTETYAYAGNARGFMLQRPVSKKRGEAEFVKGVASDNTIEYEKRHYDFKILKVNVFSLERGLS